MQIQKKTPSQNSVLIVGGGIGGIRAAMDLAEAGRDVILIDKAYSIGGLITQLDRTFPTNNCDLCTLSPHLSETGRQQHINMLAMTQLVDVEGDVGNFTATLTQAPRHIDLDKCTACGDCYRKFPECVRFSPGLDHRAPTCMRYPQATPHAYSIDLKKCSDTQALTQVCQANAIVPGQSVETKKIKIGAIILSPGAAVFDPAGLDNFSYGVLPDVVTSLEYERILSASGPTQGELVRPSNGEQPKRIAWIQCVGSRGLQKGAASYCSSACCMFSLKEAIVTKERFQQSIETTIFYMDMRTFGKDYEQYRNRAENEFGVQFVRSRPHSIIKDAETGDLKITFATDNESVLQNEIFDMAVLATGFHVSEDVRRMASMLGIELNRHDFAQTGSFSPVCTSKPGIFVCGLFESPKDIPETIVQASAAACMASKSLESPTDLMETDTEPVLQRDVSHEEPKIGVFICDCGLNIGSIIDTRKLSEYARKLPQVAVSEVVGHGCSKESLDRIERAIDDQGLNRVVIGGCSPRTHETKFQEVLKKTGLNKYLLEIANIREQATWVHADNPSAASAKAEHLIHMAVSSVKKAHPLVDHSLSMNKDILVVGGGVTGMNTALTLADQGFKVFLVEQSAALGGLANKIRKTLQGEDVQTYMKALIQKTVKHDLIEVITGAIIVDHSGMPGLFKTGMQIAPQMYYRQIKHGVTILATGALQNRPQEYLLGEHPAVMNQMDMDALIEDDPEGIAALESVAMIQCVGSRCPDNANCSRICCQSAVKNALRIRDMNPEVRIFVLYRDMRTYGFSEDFYLEARKKGVIFVRYEKDTPPHGDSTQR